MAAGPALFLELDDSAQGLASPQLLKSRTTAQTAITAAKLSQNIRDVSFAEDNVEFMGVHLFTAISAEVWADGADGNAPVLDVYGWNDSGPGHHIGTVTATLGNFTSAANTGFHASAATHESIRRAYLAGTAYRGADTYAITADYQVESVTDNAASPITTPIFKCLSAMAVQEADFPGHFIIDLQRSRYKYISVLVTSLGSATTVGLIFRPVGLKQELR